MTTPIPHLKVTSDRPYDWAGETSLDGGLASRVKARFVGSWAVVKAHVVGNQTRSINKDLPR